MDKCPTNGDVFTKSNQYRISVTSNQYSGWLKKQSSKIRKLKKSYFLLKNCTLSHYTNDELTKLLGKISIRNCVVELDKSDVDSGEQFGFTIRPALDKSPLLLHLFCKSAEERTQWIRAIQRSLYLSLGGGLFGTELSLQFRYCSNETKFLPRVVYDCMEYILKEAIQTEGIFRKCAQKNHIDALVDDYNQARFLEGRKKLTAHTAAGLLKHYLRELPEPVVPYHNYDSLKATGYRIEANEDISPVIDSLNNLPAPNYILLKELCIFLHKVSQYSDENKMDSACLGSVFSPNIFRQEEDDPSIEISASPIINLTMDYWIRRQEQLFILDTKPLHEAILETTIHASETLNSIAGISGSLETLPSRSDSPGYTENPDSHYYPNSIPHSMQHTNSLRKIKNLQQNHQNNFGNDNSDDNPNQSSPKTNYGIRRAWNSLRASSSSNRHNQDREKSTSRTRSVKSPSQKHNKEIDLIVQRPQRPSSPSKIEDYKNLDFHLQDQSRRKFNEIEVNNNSISSSPNNIRLSWEIKKQRSLLNRMKSCDIQSSNSNEETYTKRDPEFAASVTHHSVNDENNPVTSNSFTSYLHRLSQPVNTIVPKRSFGSFCIDQNQTNNRTITLDQLLDYNITSSCNQKDNLSKSESSENNRRSTESFNELCQSLNMARIEIAREKALYQRLSMQLSKAQGDLNLAQLEIQILRNRVNELENKISFMTPSSAESTQGQNSDGQMSLISSNSIR